MNIEVKIPIDNVTAKPLTGPEPRPNNIIAAISVVMFASTIVLKASLYPVSIVAIGERPCLTSSLILSKIYTFACTAIPIVKTIPAIPGSVKVALIDVSIANKINKLKIKAILAKIPNTP